MNKKITYKVKNWPEYNKSLVKRGNVTIWFNESSIARWENTQQEKARRGRPQKYTDFAIECTLTFRGLYRLPLRAAQGFLEGLINLLGLKISSPDYTTLSRRAKLLEIDLGISRKSGENIDIVIDSTGLKVYGEGEWKMRVHGKQKRRTWRKLHITMDPVSHQTISMELTVSNVHDSVMLPSLLSSQKDILNVYADGAYGYEKCFDAIDRIGAKAIIAIRGGTALAKKPTSGLKQRNRIVKEMWACGGRYEWQKKSGYHRRSLVENQMYRYKTIFGEKLQSRNFMNQFTEAKIKLSVLNRMTSLGMPESVAIN
jgi:hypothetical protein